VILYKRSTAVDEFMFGVKRTELKVSVLPALKCERGKNVVERVHERCFKQEREEYSHLLAQSLRRGA